VIIGNNSLHLMHSMHPNNITINSIIRPIIINVIEFISGNETSYPVLPITVGLSDANNTDFSVVSTCAALRDALRGELNYLLELAVTRGNSLVLAT